MVGGASLVPITTYEERIVAPSPSPSTTSLMLQWRVPDNDATTPEIHSNNASCPYGFPRGLHSSPSTV
jgi:hypothetical protein